MVYKLRYGLALTVGLSGLVMLGGCKDSSQQTSVADNSGADPSDANQAPVSPGGQQTYPAAAPQSGWYAGQAAASGYASPKTRVLGQARTNEAQQQAESYTTSGQQPAPVERAPDAQNDTPPSASYVNDQAYQGGGENFDRTIDQYAAEQAPQPPPPLPVYEQPPCPEPNDIWTPGYWSYAPAGYFWVPGAWVAAPYRGALWTPGYWGGYGNGYRFHRGFWGIHIGFYGGINYGFGYLGSGYRGGYWNGDNFYYNRAVTRVDATVVRNVYVRNVTVNNTTINNTVVNNRISYNGGQGGVPARPQAYELAAMREQHTPPMATQTQLREQSLQNRQQFYSANQGRPAIPVARPLIADLGVAAPPRAQPQPQQRNGGNELRSNPPVEPQRLQQDQQRAHQALQGRAMPPQQQPRSVAIEPQRTQQAGQPPAQPEQQRNRQLQQQRTVSNDPGRVQPPQQDQQRQQVLQQQQRSAQFQQQRDTRQQQDTQQQRNQQEQQLDRQRGIQQPSPQHGEPRPQARPQPRPEPQQQRPEPPRGEQARPAERR